jgi:hypothetical protein
MILKDGLDLPVQKLCETSEYFNIKSLQEVGFYYNFALTDCFQTLNTERQERTNGCLLAPVPWRNPS